MQKALLFLLGIMTITQSGAQENGIYEKKTFMRDSTVLQYRIMYPENYTPLVKYPVVLFLHGAGERGNNNEGQLKHGGSFFANAANRKAFPAIIVFPQCPFTDFWARISLNFKEDDSLGRLVFPANVPAGKTLDLVSKLMDSLAEGNNVDKNRIYIGGLSMGGMGTFELLWRKPGFFAAAIAICGGGNPEKVTTYAKGFPIWVFHGDKDPTVKVGNSRLIVNALKKAGANVKYTEYPGVLHNSWNNAFDEPELLPWLFGQKK
ncbi:carboxylesterase family protein [Flavitalea sp.]|nr:dienelactone hydrolase family protein [Flavitalea sp.]